jgi:hypothetical protein
MKVKGDVMMKVKVKGDVGSKTTSEVALTPTLQGLAKLNPQLAERKIVPLSIFGGRACVLGKSLWNQRPPF